MIHIITDEQRHIILGLLDANTNSTIAIFDGILKHVPINDESRQRIMDTVVNLDLELYELISAVLSGDRAEFQAQTEKSLRRLRDVRNSLER